MNESPVEPQPGRVLRARGPEAGLAALLLGVAVLVMADSARIGIGWAEDGPRSGTFPFSVGLMLAASAAWILGSQLLRWSDGAAFAGHAQLVRVGSIALPIALYLGAIFPLGIYVASALLIGGFMRALGRARWRHVLPLAAGVPLLLFGVFERWFLVPLPKGPLERLLGL